MIGLSITCPFWPNGIMKTKKLLSHKVTNHLVCCPNQEKYYYILIHPLDKIYF